MYVCISLLIKYYILTFSAIISEYCFYSKNSYSHSLICQCYSNHLVLSSQNIQKWLQSLIDMSMFRVLVIPYVLLKHIGNSNLYDFAI